jgi:ribonuclease HI
MAKKQRFYVVWNGYTPGIYTTWADCQQEIKSFPGAAYKAFDSRAEAEQAFRDGAASYLSAGRSGAAKKKTINRNSPDIIENSIAVDAACSGNPGIMEYQGVDTRTGQQLFHKKFPLGTNNIGEFLGIVHALAYCQKLDLHLPIYTDSKIAMKWVKDKKCKTQLQTKPGTRALMEVIKRAEDWLKNNSWDNALLKWETESWGEIPADFGRK